MNGFLSNFSRDALAIFGLILALVQTALALASMGVPRRADRKSQQRRPPMKPAHPDLHAEASRFWSRENEPWIRAWFGALGTTVIVVGLFIAGGLTDTPDLAGVGILLALVQFGVFTFCSVILLEEWIIHTTGHHWGCFPLRSWRFLGLLGSLAVGYVAIRLLLSVVKIAARAGGSWLDVLIATYSVFLIGWIAVMSLFLLVMVLMSLLVAIPSTTE